MFPHTLYKAPNFFDNDMFMQLHHHNVKVHQLIVLPEYHVEIHGLQCGEYIHAYRVAWHSELENRAF